jgi:hypothetical protein
MACGLLSVLTLLPAGVSAGGPAIFRFEWQDQPEFSFDCGTHVITSESDGFGHAKEWYDADGNLDRSQVFLWINNVVTTTRADGSTQSWEDIGRHTDFFDFEAGVPITGARAGLTYNIHAPDGGIILHDVGSFVFNFETGQLEHAGGPKDFWLINFEGDFEDIVELFCTTFA